MLKEFDRIETDRIDAGKHEQFHKMLTNLRHVCLD